MIAIETFRETATGHNNRSEKQKPFAMEGLDIRFRPGTELDNPVWRDLKLIRRPQGVTLQQQIKLAAQAQIPWPFADNQRLMRHKERGLHHPAAESFQPQRWNTSSTLGVSRQP